MRARFALFLFLFLFSIPALSQGQKAKPWNSLPKEAEAATRAFPPQLRNELAQIRDAALQDDYAYRQLEHLTDSIGPRPQGSLQADAAVHYVADELRKLGLEVHLEPVPVRRFLRGNDSAELVEYPGQVSGTTQRIFITALYGNAPTPEGGITGDVILVHDFDEFKALGKEKIAGKIVLWDVHYDSRKAAAGRAGSGYGEAVRYRGVGGLAAAELGAVASMVRSAGDGEVRLPHTGWSADAHIPAGAVSAEDADLIARLASHGTVRIHLSLPTHDGAGVVVAMETAELIQRLRLHPKRTIRVIAWMNEEMGATGRDVYAKDHASELGNHVAAMESDLGAEHPLGFHAKISEAGQQELSPVQDVLTMFGANLLERVPDSPETDIEPLADKGVPVLGIWQNGLTYFKYHHTPADTLDKVVPEELRENAAAMAVMGYALANMTEPLVK